MKKGKACLINMLLVFVLSATGCGQSAETAPERNVSPEAELETQETGFTLSNEILKLEEGFEAVRMDGDYGFPDFLRQGGAASDREVAEFLSSNLLNNVELNLLGSPFGCSTISTASPEGDALFGRNFDWNICNAMVVASYPEQGYASISTVNMDFVQQGGGAIGLALKLDQVRSIAALYAPLDGMNEKGLTVSVNMIQDNATIEQETEKPDLTTTTAVRLLLNQAADVEEALALLERYDLHASMGYMIHFAIADRKGHSVAAEYVNNEMVVVETPAMTNFYLAEGEKNGIGTEQSHERYEILMEALSQNETMTMDKVRDALSSVSKGNFGEFESTEWSIVFNQTTGEARYYHRENYDTCYSFNIEGGATE